MAATKYRMTLLRLLDPDPGRVYVANLHGLAGCVQFTSDWKQAQVFDTWDAFVDAAAAVWRCVGPCNLSYEETVVVVPRRVARG